MLLKTVETVLDYVLDISHNNDFDGPLDDLTFLHCSPLQLWGLRGRTCCKKTSPSWWRNLTTRNELNQSELNSLDVSHCWIFKAGIKNLIFHSHPTIKVWRFCSCSSTELWGFRCRFCWKNTRLLFRRILSVRNERKESGLHWLDVSHWRNFNSGIKELIFQT